MNDIKKFKFKFTIIILMGNELSSYSHSDITFCTKINCIILYGIKCNNTNKGFPSLKEFCFKGSKRDLTIVFNEIMKYTKHLRQINLTIYDYGTHQLFQDERKINKQKLEFEKAYQKLLSIPTLQQIDLHIESKPILISFLQTLDIALMKHIRNKFILIIVLYKEMDDIILRLVTSMKI